MWGRGGELQVEEPRGGRGCGVIKYKRGAAVRELGLGAPAGVWMSHALGCFPTLQAAMQSVGGEIRGR